MENQAAVRPQSTVAQQVLAVLPLILFLPQPFVWWGFLAFLVALIPSGLSGKLVSLRHHPLSVPVLLLLALSVAAGLLLERPQGEFWSGFLHYQTYLLLLLFITVGPGRWQQRAVGMFYLGATIAATLFYLNSLGLLPNWWLLRSYVTYGGNKSILLGILLAVAAGWMLYDVVSRQHRHWIYSLQFAYVAIAAVALARTRSGLLVFILLCLFVVLNAIKSWPRRVGVVVVLALILYAVAHTVPKVNKRMNITIAEVGSLMKGERAREEGERIDLLYGTLRIIREKPLTGHGIGTWFSNYEQKKDPRALVHTTPHNDYLLYLSEMGLLGLAALLLIWARQFMIANRMRGEMGARLAMLSIALVVGGMFNAILRDAVFGLAFMILLAIPLAGVVQHRQLSNVQAPRAQT